jgi:hypothetical protein
MKAHDCKQQLKQRANIPMGDGVMASFIVAVRRNQ